MNTNRYQPSSSKQKIYHRHKSKEIFEIPLNKRENFKSTKLHCFMEILSGLLLTYAIFIRLTIQMITALMIERN